MKNTNKTLSLFLAVLCLISLITGCKTAEKTNSESSTHRPSLFSTPKTLSVKEIEITTENWDTYFEFVEKEKEYKNKYNETEHIQFYYAFVLKDGYIMADKGTEIEMEYSFIESFYRVEEDLINKKIIWGEHTGTSEEPVIQEYRITRAESKVAGESLFIGGTSKSKCSDFKVLRIYGTLAIME